MEKSTANTNIDEMVEQANRRFDHEHQHHNHNHNDKKVEGGLDNDACLVCRRSTLSKFTKEVFIKSISIVNYEERDGHIYYVIRVQGKTKYLIDLNQFTHKVNNMEIPSIQTQGSQVHSNGICLAEYQITKRYSELLTFHKLLQQEMKNFLKKKGFPIDNFPEFPGKKLFFNKEKGFIQKRINQINQYFEQIYNEFPQKIPYTNAVIDLCQPFKLNVAVIGSKKSGKTTYIEEVVRILTEKNNKKNKNSDQGKDQQELGQSQMTNLGSQQRNYQQQIEIINNQNSGLSKSTQSLKNYKGFSSSDNVIKQNNDMSSLQTQETTFQSNLPDFKGNLEQKESDQDDLLLSKSKSLSPLDNEDQKQINKNNDDMIGMSQFKSQSHVKIAKSKGNSRESSITRKVKKNRLGQKSLERQTISSQNGIEGRKNKNKSPHSNTSDNQKRPPKQGNVESYFPFDVPHNRLLFRLDVQEFDVEEADLRTLINIIIKSEEKNAIIFTFDITKISSFEKFLKEALRSFVFEIEELSDTMKSKRMIPFMILGMKQDLIAKSKVSSDEVKSLIMAMKQYVKCDLQYVSNNEEDDILSSLLNLFCLVDETYSYSAKSKKAQPNAQVQTKQGLAQNNNQDNSEKRNSQQID